MSEPQQPPPAPPPAEPAVVEWGSGRVGGWALADGAWWRRRFGWSRTPGWSRRLAWVLAGLGALALFGSLVGEWQVLHQDAADFAFPGEESDPERLALGIGSVLVWGTGWLVGGLLIAACAALALAGQPPLRSHARTVGLALAAVELVLLAGAAVALTEESLYALGQPEIEISLGRGVYAAVASVVLLGGALFLAGPVPESSPAAPAAAGEDTAGPPAPAYQEPADLTVAPAEPFAHPDGHHWR